ncbi:uncharacterized protein TNCV_47791 [Trichonephila clavipes]|nr:uncharacterized protein TNCV_47791 [Trichonephila clavipes]
MRNGICRKQVQHGDSCLSRSKIYEWIEDFKHAEELRFVTSKTWAVHRHQPLRTVCKSLRNYHTHLEEEYANYRKPPYGAIVRHNDESVREGYIRNGSKEVKLSTSTLKTFQCNNRIVMAQRKHLDNFYVVELLDDWKVDVPSWKHTTNLESPRVSTPGFGNDSKMMVI